MVWFLVEVSDSTEYQARVFAKDRDDAEEIASDMIDNGVEPKRGSLEIVQFDRDVQVSPITPNKWRLLAGTTTVDTVDTADAVGAFVTRMVSEGLPYSVEPMFDLDRVRS